MKYSFNILKCMVCLCVFFNMPLLTYASSKGKKCSEKKHHHSDSKPCKTGSQHKLTNNPKSKQIFKNPVTVLVTQSDVSADTQTTSQNQSVSQALIQDIAQELIQNITQDVIENVTQELRQNITQDVILNVSQELRQNITQDVIENITQEFSLNITQEDIENITQELRQNITQEVIQNITQELRQNITQEVIQNITLLINQIACNCTNDNSLALSYTAWFNNNQNTQSVPPANFVRFFTLGAQSDQTAANRIVHTPGTTDFIFVNSGTGTYVIDFGLLVAPVAGQTVEFFFGWQRLPSVTIIDGSQLQTQTLPDILSTNAFMTRINNGETLRLIYFFSGHNNNAFIGKNPTTGANYAYVTITQLE